MSTRCGASQETVDRVRGSIYRPAVDRPLRLAWWGTVAGLGAFLIGLAAFFFNALAEVLAHPGLSLVDGYWICRLPWTGVGEGFTVMGATGAVVLGTVTVWVRGRFWVRDVVFLLLLPAALFWAMAMLGTPYGAPCFGGNCPLAVPDPFSYAYSVPENTVVFLFLPALVIVALAFAVRVGWLERIDGEEPPGVPPGVPPGGEPPQADGARLAIAAATPLAGAALAYGLWWISDRLLYIGPLDRAKFGWLVVIPIWALTPVVAAYAWRPLNARQSRVAVGIVGLVITAAAALLIWLSSAFPDCQFGATFTPADVVIPALIIGAVIGGGFAAACLGAAATARRARWWVVLPVGAGSAFALVFVAIMAAAPFAMMAGCQRPP